MSHPISRRALLTIATAAVVGTALFLHSRASNADSLARVDVYDRTAREALSIYRHLGRSYVAGQPGNEYAVRIRNCTSRRMLAVVSVDGVNVITGETAAPDQSGYVIEPGHYVNVDGWRKSLQESAAFYFTDPSDAYASRTGRPDDLGVIGVALFLEVVPEREEVAALGNTATAKSSAERAAAPAADAAGPSLGTGHGRRMDDPARYTTFERASDRPDEVMRIRYERRETLARMGVLPRPPRWSPPREPDPFPGALGFVPDP
jgi:hypothetical protein